MTVPLKRLRALKCVVPPPRSRSISRAETIRRLLASRLVLMLPGSVPAAQRVEADPERLGGLARAVELLRHLADTNAMPRQHEARSHQSPRPASSWHDLRPWLRALRVTTPSSSAPATTAWSPPATWARGAAVLVLERRHVVGGACVTEETFPGFKVSTAAYVNSLFRPEIIRDLELKTYGFEMLPRNPSSFTPFPDGRSLMMGPDAELTRSEIAKFSKRDAEALPEVRGDARARRGRPRADADDDAARPAQAPARRSLEAADPGAILSTSSATQPARRSRSSPARRGRSSTAGSSRSS